MTNVNIKKLDPKATIPTYGSEFAAGCDLYSCLAEAVTIEPHQTILIKTGIALEVPQGYAGLIYARSGLACKKGICLANSVGVIDSDYRGEIKCGLINLGQEDFIINHGDRIAQLVIAPVTVANIVECKSLDETVRGEGGFGSTGV